jgi:hypothetical protein
MGTLNVQATELQKAIETGDPATRSPSQWFATAADGASPMGRWNLEDASAESVRQVAVDQHGEHYSDIVVEMFPLP